VRRHAAAAVTRTTLYSRAQNTDNKTLATNESTGDHMNTKGWNVSTALCVLAMAAIPTAPARAQMAEVKEKPPMYSYVATWSIPRARWPEMEKAAAADQKVLDKAMASGTLIGYGDDTNLIHSPEGPTHANWWSATSMAGALNVLDEIYKAGNGATPVLGSATKHADAMLVSRFYNAHAGSWKGAYSHGSSYKLKPDAPDDAVEMLSKSAMVPLLEKLLADGAIVQYEIDVEAIHSEAPGTFWVWYVSPTAEGIDKVNAALRESLRKNPLTGPAFGSMVDYTAHRDYLSRTNATFK